MVVTSIDLLLILTAQLTLSEIKELHWILNIGGEGIILSQETYFFKVCLQV